jgi:hypothetical protein
MRQIKRSLLAFIATVLLLPASLAEIVGEVNDVCAQAQTLYQKAEYEKAETALRSALKTTDHAKDASAMETAKLLNDIGLVLFKRGKRAEAASLLRRAMDVAQPLKDDRIDAAILANTALLKKREKDYAGALELAQQALKRATSKKDRTEILALISGIYQAKTDFREARKYREQIATLLNAREDADAASMNLGKLAELDEELNDRKSAESHLIAATKLAEEVPKQEDDYILTSKLLKLARFYDRQHNFPAEEATWKKLVASDKRDPTNIIGTRILLAKFYVERNRKDEARNIYKQLDAEVTASSLDPTDKAHKLTSLADSVKDSHEYALANKIYSQGIALLQQLYDKNSNSRDGRESFDLELALRAFARSAEAAGDKQLASQLLNKSDSISKRRMYYASSIGAPCWPEDAPLRWFSREEPEYNGLFLQ